MPHNITVHYYALLREERGIEEESLSTEATTTADLYDELHDKHDFSLTRKRMWVAVNDEMSDWERNIEDGDTIVFIPPVAGG